MVKQDTIIPLSQFPHNQRGVILGYENEEMKMPTKIIEMGLLPDTEFIILYQAPFHGPLYIEFGVEKSRIALRQEEAAFISAALLTAEAIVNEP